MSSEEKAAFKSIFEKVVEIGIPKGTREHRAELEPGNVIIAYSGEGYRSVSTNEVQATDKQSGITYSSGTSDDLFDLQRKFCPS